jgi:hypothetical protein
VPCSAHRGGRRSSVPCIKVAPFFLRRILQLTVYVEVPSSAVPFTLASAQVVHVEAKIYSSGAHVDATGRSEADTAKNVF